MATPSDVSQQEQALIDRAGTSGLSLTDLYKYGLGRAYDPSGLDYWLGKIGPTATGSEILEFLRSPGAVAELQASGFVPSTPLSTSQEANAIINTAAQLNKLDPTRLAESVGTGLYYDYEEI